MPNTPAPRRILILATADARGHLMRSQLLYHALRQQGMDVKVLTTSDSGAAFLAEFGVDAPVLSRRYAVIFDTQQNMQRAATDRCITHYVFFPQRMVRDIFRLRAHFRDVDLVLNDSFHPALLVMGCLPRWRKKIVHIFGVSLRRALEQNFAGRLPRYVAQCFAASMAWMIESAAGRIEHDFAAELQFDDVARSYRLPTPVALPNLQIEHQAKVDVAVYLNPHFSHADLACAIERAFAQRGIASHLVGEGYAQRPQWLARDPDWVSVAARSRVIISAPGMAGLSVAQLFGRPMILILTDQPEQQTNAERVAALGLLHRIVKWQNDAPLFERELGHALDELLAAPSPALSGFKDAEQRIKLWVNVIQQLTSNATTVSRLR